MYIFMYFIVFISIFISIFIYLYSFIPIFILCITQYYVMHSMRFKKSIIKKILLVKPLSPIFPIWFSFPFPLNHDYTQL